MSSTAKDGCEEESKGPKGDNNERDQGDNIELRSSIHHENASVEQYGAHFDQSVCRDHQTPGYPIHLGSG